MSTHLDPCYFKCLLIMVASFCDVVCRESQMAQLNREITAASRGTRTAVDEKTHGTNLHVRTNKKGG